MMKDDLIDRNALATFLNVSYGTLGVWHSIQRYALPCYKKGRQVYYTWDDIYRFISTDDEDYRMLVELQDRTPLLDRRGVVQLTRQSLSYFLKHKDSFPELKPRRVGSVIRYRRAEISQYLTWRKQQLNIYYERKLNPHLTI